MYRVSGSKEVKPSGSPASEYDRFTTALKTILSVKKSDLDLHKPIRPRKAKRKKPN